MIYVLLLLSLTSLTSLISCFPNSDSPIQLIPSLQHGMKSCTITLIDNQYCNSWNDIITSSISIDTSLCSIHNINQVILSLNLKENGTQYDRYGAVWINEIEVLRTTTAEPTSKGIEWNIEKDVTIYLDYFLQYSNNLTTYLSIPNNVDSTYTGIINVNASLTFYFDTDTDKDIISPTIIPLTKASSNNFWSSIQMSGNETLNYTIPFLSIKDMSSVFLDIYASQHGCEEFYYSNVPSEDAEKLGLCGGGVYREIQIWIDDTLAGIVLPFATIYSGGINPLAWRPITGILSFDIISHKVDLTPFAGIFMSESQHILSIKVVGNNNEGYWFIDSSLIVQRNPLNYIESCSLISHQDNGPIIVLNRNFHLPDKYIYSTNSTHDLFISSTIVYSNDNGVKTYSVSTKIELFNVNDLVGSSLDYTVQTAKSTTSSSINDENMILQIVSYPLIVKSSYSQNNDTFDMSASIKYGYEKINSYITNDSNYTISIRSNIITNAVYNRSTIDQSQVYKQSDESNAGYIVTSNDDICYKSYCQATDGYFISDAQSVMCKMPSRLSICSYDICGKYMDISSLHNDLKSIKVSSIKNENLKEKKLSYELIKSADIENIYRSYNK